MQDAPGTCPLNVFALCPMLTLYCNLDSRHPDTTLFVTIRIREWDLPKSNTAILTRTPAPTPARRPTRTAAPNARAALRNPLSRETAALTGRTRPSAQRPLRPAAVPVATAPLTRRPLPAAFPVAPLTATTPTVTRILTLPLFFPLLLCSLTAHTRKDLLWPEEMR